MAKITRIQRIAKIKKMELRKQEQRNRKTNKNFQTKENEGGLTFAEVLQEKEKRFDKSQHTKPRGYFMKDTMSKEYWEERQAEIQARISLRGV